MKNVKVEFEFALRVWDINECRLKITVVAYFFSSNYLYLELYRPLLRISALPPTGGGAWHAPLNQAKSPGPP